MLADIWRHRFSTIFSNGGLHYLHTAQRLSSSGRRRLPMLSRGTVVQGGGPGQWWEVLVQLDKQDGQQCRTLQLQLAVTLDAGKPFVTGTYSLEGDGEAIVIACRTLQEISTAAAVQNYPKTIAAAQEIAGGNQMEADGLVRTAKTYVALAARYF